MVTLVAGYVSLAQLTRLYLIMFIDCKLSFSSYCWL